MRHRVLRANREMNKAVLFEILDWCGQHSALLVAIVGFASSVAIAKITSGLDLKKTLCIHRFEAYEKAIRHLSLKLNVYYGILAAFQSLHEPISVMDVMKGKVAVLLSFFIRLEEIEKEDRDLAAIVLYSKLPQHDVRSLTKESALFVILLKDFSDRANMPNSDAMLAQLVPTFNKEIQRLEPLIAEEAAHLNAIYAQLCEEIHKDKTIKKVLRVK